MASCLYSVTSNKNSQVLNIYDFIQLIHYKCIKINGEIRSGSL